MMVNKIPLPLRRPEGQGIKAFRGIEKGTFFI